MKPIGEPTGVFLKLKTLFISYNSCSEYKTKDQAPNFALVVYIQDVQNTDDR